jgi:large subunit ribosomal protein L4
MPSLSVYDLSKKKMGSIDLNDAIFAAEVKPHLVNDAVRTQIARRYEWKTANSLTRTEVKASGIKIYKQKGTGQARHGDIKAPIFVGGGKAHGPKPRLVIKKINKKVMKQALISVLTLNQKEDRLFVIDKMEMDKPNSKAISNALKAFGITSALVVNSEEAANEKNFNISSRNIRAVKFVRPEGVNVFDLLKFKNLVISKKAVQKITERLSHV